MNTRNTRTKLMILVIAAVSLAASWMAWHARPVLAIQDQEEQLPPFGLAMGQTARLNVLNSGEERGFVIDWKFLDGLGRVLAESRQPHLFPPGQFMSFDVDGDSLGGMRDRFGRVQLRAVVSAMGNPSLRTLHVSVEVFDKATGKTTFIQMRCTDPSNDK